MSSGYTVVELNGTGSQCLYVRARRMIADGFAPDELIEWVRDGIPVFARPDLLCVWAALEVRESEGGA